MYLYIWNLTAHGKDLETAIAGYPEEIKELLRKSNPMSILFPEGSTHNETLQEYWNIQHVQIAEAICRAKETIARKQTETKEPNPE